MLSDIKKHIKEAQVKSLFAASKEMLKLYWYIGQKITMQQKVNGWGSKTVEKLAEDLQKSFPGITGFSQRNIFRMQAFFSAYENTATAVAQITDLPLFDIPWGHNAVILEKLKNNEERFWYAQKAIEHGWSRSMLETWIKSNLYKREGKAITNFTHTLPVPQSDMAQQSATL